jgi:hypothetical protein
LFYLPPSMAVACRAVQLGEAVLLKKPVSPMSFAPRISHFVLKV